MRSLLAVGPQDRGMLVAVLAHVAAGMLPATTLTTVCQIGMDSFTRPGCTSGLCMLLASLLQHDSAADSIVQFLRQPSCFELLLQIMKDPPPLSSPVTQVHVTMADQQGGSAAWIAREGSHDGIVSLALAVLPRLKSAQAERMVRSIWELQDRLHPSQLSPSGQVVLASLIYDSVCVSPAMTVPSLIQPKAVSILAQAIRLRPLKKILAWPTEMGGGSGAVASLVRQTVSTLYLPVMHSTADLETFSASISQGHLVTSLVAAMDVLSPESLAAPLGLLARILLLPDESHMDQFIACGPLTHPTLLALVEHAQHPSATIEQVAAMELSLETTAVGDLVAILSHVARVAGTRYYGAVLESGIISRLGGLLASKIPDLRAKMCNLIGNLCKHGNQFYPLLATHDRIIPELCLRLRDFDSSVRKFAGFALGNAGFHDSSLYPRLEGR
eukprot:TRINITY_DN26642_c0_g1_i2.p1 TRINITY_DN26642_c0_g1~~TRINITY_DN26642_c0_g1_i2.p1  ORF type:complete len:443 (+),score=91.38 TRINITY_DN26642_c0_g1_i2:323-1651(+)